MVRDLIKEYHLELPEGKRRLNSAGLQAVTITAERIANSVDELVKNRWNRKLGEIIQIGTTDELQPETTQEPEIVTCACGSGIPIQKVLIAGKEVTVVGLPLIFQQFYEAGKSPTEENINELMDTIKVYNSILDGEEPAYRIGIQKKYKDYWFKEKDK
jgi:hypothetical protein